MRLLPLTKGLPGWKNALLALLSAALLVLAFPDFDYWFLAWFALAPMMWAAEREKESTARSFVVGWIFGTVFFFGTCWWLTYAPITYAGFPPILAYFLLFCVCLVAGLFPAAFAAILSVLLRRFGSVALLAAPFVWVFTEFLRYWITGNNWNALAYSQAFGGDETLHYASLGGVYLVSVRVVGVSAVLLWIVSSARSNDNGRRRMILVAGIGVMLLSFLAKDVFLERRPANQELNEAGVATVIGLQPNVPMSGLTYERWQALRRRHEDLAHKALRSGIEGYAPMAYDLLDKKRGEESKLILDEFDKFAERYAARGLRTKNLSRDETEVRVWVGFAPNMTRGLILSQQSAVLLGPLGESASIGFRKPQSLEFPTGTGELWNDPSVQQLLRLPDEPSTERIEPALDSDVVVVEIKQGNEYRTIQYGFPCNSRGSSARKLTDSITRIGEKLGVDFYRCADESRANVTSPRPVTVIFPESPMNFMYETDPETREFIGGFARKNNVSVLFNSAEPDALNGKYYNSAVMVGPQGGEVAQYDKIYLLPFGEAVPFPLEGILPGFVGNFSYGKEYDLLPVGDAKAGVMICFESHFGALSREYVRNGADVILEMTNDGYLGPTPVLRQHLANAVFRAVETNRPVLRVTNVGITAYINEKGEVLDAAPAYQTDTRVWSVSKSDGSQTFYVRYGDWFAWLCTLVTLGLIGFAITRRESVAST